MSKEAVISNGLETSALNALQVGQIGEYLVAVDLIRKGYEVSLASSGQPYDIIAVKSNVPILVQVKASNIRVRKNEYAFTVHAHGVNKYEGMIMAFCGVDTGEIGYAPAKASTGKRRFQPAGTPYHARRKGLNLSDNTLEKALNEAV